MKRARPDRLSGLECGMLKRLYIDITPQELQAAKVAAAKAGIQLAQWLADAVRAKMKAK